MREYPWRSFIRLYMEWRNNEEKETALLLKTSNKLVMKLTERVKALHSYDCPCITALNIVDGNADYLTWIKQETL